MKLRTEIEHKPMQQLIAPGDGLMLVGSCFTDHIGSWLQQMWLPVCCNPWGVLFNPASIAISLRRLANCFDVEFPLLERDGKFYSFAHHGQWAGSDCSQVQQNLQMVEAKARKSWQAAKHVIVTFGTAWVYEREGEIVANCHKFPANEFVRRMLAIEEIVGLWQPIIESSLDRHFIFTVSPIRHIGDGLHGNQLSKATLLLAIEHLQQTYPDQVDYLPVYELFIDDLRDYRFYADDLVHPSPLGIEMVKDLFTDCCFSRDMKNYAAEALSIVKALQHRPSDPDSERHKAFVSQQMQQQQQLIEKYNESRR